jgi:hypothetical protein
MRLTAKTIGCNPVAIDLRPSLVSHIFFGFDNQKERMQPSVFFNLIGVKLLLSVGYLVFVSHASYDSCGVQLLRAVACLLLNRRVKFDTLACAIIDKVSKELVVP